MGRNQVKIKFLTLALARILLLQILIRNFTTGELYNYVILDGQGAISGLKIFPESSKTAVFAFLGVPYAEPPVDNLRFAVAQPNSGWNKTLLTNYMQPICPQLTNSIYDETPDRILPRQSIIAEDCLYLNIWTPEIAFKQGNLPVLVIISGEEMSFDWAKHRISGLDLASEGIVVVHIQYRSNIFGWMTMNNPEFPGNFGLSDQTLALLWIQNHIIKFGGNPDSVTILGHGTTGVTCSLLHLISPKTEELFSKMILMSGTSLNFQVTTDKRASETMIIKLGCFDEKSSIVLRCLRSKSVSDLLNAFDIVYQHGNYSILPGPVMDTFRMERNQYVPKNLDEVLKAGEYRKIPTIIGICSNEGALIRDYWIDLAREGFESLRAYINFTTLPLILRKYFFLNGDNNQVIKALNWRYFQLVSPRHPSYLLNSMQRLLSEAEYEAPFYNIIELMARAIHGHTTPSDAVDLYVYVYQNSNTMDLRGKINLFGGASHSSDLPLLFGPSLFQQIARRRFTQAEEKICRKLRQFFSNFIKTGNPTPGRIYDAWMTYTVTKKYIKILGEMTPQTQSNEELSSTFLEKNFLEIEEMLHKTAGTLETSPSSREINNPYDLNKLDVKQRPKSTYLVNRQDYEYFSRLKKIYSFWNVLLPSIYRSSNPIDTFDTSSTNDRSGKTIVIREAEILEANKYKHAFFWMLGLVCFLLASLGICTYVLRRDHPDWVSDL